MPGISRAERFLYALAALLVILLVIGFAVHVKNKSDACSQWHLDVTTHDFSPDTFPDPGPSPC